MLISNLLICQRSIRIDAKFVLIHTSTIHLNTLSFAGHVQIYMMRALRLENNLAPPATENGASCHVIFPHHHISAEILDPKHAVIAHMSR